MSTEHCNSLNHGFEHALSCTLMRCHALSVRCQCACMRSHARSCALMMRVHAGSVAALTRANAVSCAVMRSHVLSCALMCCHALSVVSLMRTHMRSCALIERTLQVGAYCKGPRRPSYVLVVTKSVRTARVSAQTLSGFPSLFLSKISAVGPGV